jgi:hypothetical protein
MSEDFNHIDQIIRQKFDNFEPEPPLEVWDKIKSGISKTPPPPSSPGILLPIIVSVSLLIFVAGLFHHFYKNTIQSAQNIEAGSITIQSASLGSTGSTTTSGNLLQEAFTQAQPEIASAAPDAGTILEPKASTMPVRAPFNQDVKADRKKKHSNSATQSTITSPPRTGQWKPGLVQALQSGELTYANAAKYNLSPRDVKKLYSYRETSKTKFADWSIGLYFNPEVTSCKDKSIENTISYNLSLLPQVSFNRFFLQSGVNMRFTHDNGNMAVDYNRFLGTYEDVYLVTFDSTENGIIPTYYTQTVEVYDTISHYAVSETKASYAYLEIPVLFGYRYTFGKFSLFAKAGPSASFMIGKRVPEAVNPEDKARIVNVNYQVPLRSTINWQLMMGAGFDYKLADKLSFSLEPTFRFALKPEYDLPAGTTGKTRSFGIRAGLNYNF